MEVNGSSDSITQFVIPKSEVSQLSANVDSTHEFITWAGDAPLRRGGGILHQERCIKYLFKLQQFLPYHSNVVLHRNEHGSRWEDSDHE